MSILVTTAMIVAVNDEEDMDVGEEDSRTKLDTNSNMVVVD